MKTGKALAMGCLMVVAAMDAESRTGSGDCVTVQLYGAQSVPLDVLQSAEATASRIFGDIGVSVSWKGYTNRPLEGVCLAIHVELSKTFPAELKPGALALAFPYRDGGTQIQVFLDRVLTCASSMQNGLLLGHVMTHEIGHVLEGIDRHSEQGVMKAHWDGRDFQKCSRGRCISPPWTWN